jgi:hypothetical protein
MKYALISEEQIKQVQDALGPMAALEGLVAPSDGIKFKQALAIVQSLKPSEPVAFIENHKAGQNLSWSQDDLPYAKATPLYALEVTK